MGGSHPQDSRGWRVLGRRITSNLVLLSTAVLAIICLGAGAVVLLNRSATASGPTEPDARVDPTPTQPVGADTPTEVVHRYLQALAAGRAADALALGEDQPKDKTFLTDSMLRASAARTPITDITVREEPGADAGDVHATYRLGKKKVTEIFSADNVGGSWRLTKTFAELDLRLVRSRTLPLRFDGVLVATKRVEMFPGSYEVTSGSDHIGYGAKTVMLLESPSDHADLQALTPRLTDTGKKAFAGAARAAIGTCLKQRASAPDGCPFGIQPLAGQKFDQSTVRWAMTTKVDWEGLPITLHPKDPVVARASLPITFEFSATGTRGDHKERYGPLKVYTVVHLQARMTQQPLHVTFRAPGRDS